MKNKYRYFNIRDGCSRVSFTTHFTGAKNNKIIKQYSFIFYLHSF